MSASQDLKSTFKHARLIFVMAVILLVLIHLATGFYSVKPQQRGVVKRFGRIVDDCVLPGIHYHIPWPVETVLTTNTTEVRTMAIQFRDTSNVNILDRGGALLTGDENLIWTTLVLQYTIKAPGAFLNISADTAGLLNRLTQSATLTWFAGVGVDEALTTGRQEFQLWLKKDIQRSADAGSIGIHINSVQIQTIEPPAKVAQAFKDVASAREDKQNTVQEAQGERNRRLPRARGEVEEMLREAEAHAQEVVQMAKGDGERFLSNWKEYRKSKSITAHRLYMETAELVMSRVKKLIVDPDAEKNVK